LNPTALILVVLGIVLILVAWEGTQANLAAAMLGHAPGWAPTFGGKSLAQADTGPGGDRSLAQQLVNDALALQAALP
jgi:hypothetical protein